MKTRSIVFLLGIVTFVLCHAIVVRAEDQAYFSADTTSPLVGEPVQLILHVRVPQGAQLVLPDFKKDLAPLAVAVVGALNISKQNGDGTVVYEIPLTVILWRTGNYETPHLKLTYQLAGSSAVNLNIESFQFVVPSILQDSDLSLRPLKSVIDLPYFPVLQIVLLAAVIVGSTLVFGRKRLQQMRRQAFDLGYLSTTGNPEVAYALKTLQQIEQLNGTPYDIYVQVSECLRHYLFKRYAVAALDLTTSELITKLSEKILLTDEHQQKLAEMLKRADLVKFAHVIPKQGTAQQYLSAAIQWIQVVEQHNLGQPS